MTYLFGLVIRYSNQMMDLKTMLTSAKDVAAKMARHDAETIKSLRERVNPLHKEIEKLGEAWKRARYL